MKNGVSRWFVEGFADEREQKMLEVASKRREYSLLAVELETEMWFVEESRGSLGK